MSVLKIRDKNGNVIDVPVLRGKKGDPGAKGDKGEKGDPGAKGDTYILTDADKEEIAQMVESPTHTTVATNEKYFSIDYDGIVSLKPEYQNGGSENAELPKKIVIPDVVNGTSVSGLIVSMFEENLVVEEITLPDSVTAIPNRFCAQAKNLKAIHNTEHITKVGERIILRTQVKKAMFPNLKEAADGAFAEANFLYTVDIGDNITTIPMGMFRNCAFLSLVKGGNSVNTINAQAFYATRNLKNLPLLSNVTSIGDLAFYQSRIQFDWDSLENCAFGVRATPVIDNTEKYWEGFKPEACENPIITQMSQSNPAWKDSYFYGSGTEGKKYSACASVLAILHIYSALTYEQYEHPDEFKTVLETANSAFITKEYFPSTFSNVKTIFEGLGCNVIERTGKITSATYQELCDALKDGAYVYSQVSTYQYDSHGHVAILYGINSNGEVLVLDSGTLHAPFAEVDVEDIFTYRMPFQNLTGPESSFVIVKKGAVG